jgi:putative membrane protein
MQTRYAIMVACGAIAIAACAGAQASSVSKADRDFMSTVATMDMTGAHEAEMAQNKANRAEVKDFAKMVVKDDSESFGHLAELAAKTSVTIPRGINAARIPAIESLNNLKGDSFDRQFTRDQINAEERELAIFKHEAKFGQNSDVKAYASNMIPVFNADLARAKECAGTKTATK